MKKNLLHKICIGTAQYNQKYGVTNSNILNKKEFFNILDLAVENGINSFDTAQNYKSEERIGNFISSNNLSKVAKVTSKFNLVSSKGSLEYNLKKSIEFSLKNLKCPIYSYLLHDPNYINLILNNFKLANSLKKNFPIKYFGFSIYKYKEYEKIVKLNKKRLAFQIPSNLVNNEFQKIKKENTSVIFVRSVFLQGLLLKKKFTNNLNLPLSLKKFLKRYIKILNQLNINPLELCLSHAFNLKYMDYLVLGFNSKSQLQDTINIVKKKKLIYKNKEILDFLSSYKNMKFSDPRLWKKI